MILDEKIQSCAARDQNALTSKKSVLVRVPLAVPEKELVTFLNQQQPS